MEEGYTCWVNFWFLYAFSLAHEVAMLLDEKELISSTHLSFRKHFLHSVNELFMTGDRYVRRIDPQGNMDLRPDFTLLSPYYFGFLQYAPQMERSVRFLERQLWDPELGMIMRYLPFYKDFATHVHAGNGPWLQYSAILAQYHFWNGNQGRGNELLDLIDGYRNRDGEIPEHLSTCKRFEWFMEKEWRPGIDFQKEFHQPILSEGIDFDCILEEANNMARSYEETGKKCMITDSRAREGGYTQFAMPLMWSHVEYSRALLVRAKDWWKMD
jgi:GH15 family glucan-1,4-alpha-glucosidase